MVDFSSPSYLGWAPGTGPGPQMSFIQPMPQEPPSYQPPPENPHPMGISSPFGMPVADGVTFGSTSVQAGSGYDSPAASNGLFQDVSWTPGDWARGVVSGAVTVGVGAATDNPWAGFAAGQVTNAGIGYMQNNGFSGFSYNENSPLMQTPTYTFGGAPN